MKRAPFLAALALAAWTISLMMAAAVAFARPMAAIPAITTFSPASATAGAGFTLVVNGSNFDAGTSVAVGGISLTVTSFDPGTITGTAPAGSFTIAASTYTVTVGNVDGTALAASNFTINAAAASVITVTPSSATNVTAGSNSTNFSATAADQYGNPVAASAINWNSTDTGKGTVSPATGGSTTLTAGTVPGTYAGLVRASSGSAQATADVTIVPAAASTLIITPTSATLSAGQTQAFTAAVYDTYGNVRSGDAPTWSSASGSFSPQGAQTSTTYTPPNTPGTYTVNATFGALPQKSATITVTAGAPSIVSISAPAANLNLNAPVSGQSFAASVRDTLGNDTGLSPNWSATGGSFTVNTGPSTTYTPPNTPGTYTVTASYAGASSATRQVIVAVGSPSVVSITTPAANLNLNAPVSGQSFVASVRDGANNDTGLLPSWSATGGSFTVNTGTSTTYTPPNTPGTYTVTASYAGASSATRRVVVSAGSASVVSITTPAGNLNLNAPVSGQSFAASVRDGANNDTGLSPSWSASGGSFTLNTGTSTTYTPPNVVGTYVVTASYSGATPATRQVVVAAGSASVVSITTPSASIITLTAPVSGQSFAASVRDAYNNDTGLAPSWTATGGSFTLNTGTSTTYTPPNTPGTYTVTASYGGATSATRRVVVQAGAASQLTIAPSPGSMTAGGNIAFTAYVSDSVGNTVSTGTVSWSVTSGVGSISPGGTRTATFSSNTAGSAVVSATLGAAGNTANVTVNPGAASKVTVAPSSASVTVATRTFLTATVTDSLNNVISSGNVTWTIASGGGTLNASPSARSTYLDAPSTPGTTIVRAYFGAVSVPVTFTVNVGPPVSVTLTPSPLMGAAGSQGTLTAVVRDSQNNIIPGSSVTWSRLNAGASTLGSTGALTANVTLTTTAGTYLSAVRAQVPSTAISATVALNVSAGPVSNIVLTPPKVSLSVNGSQPFNAAAYDQYGNGIGDATFAWSTSDSSKATVSPAGGNTTVLTAQTTAGAFPDLLRVNSGGITQTAAITITPDVPYTITISPASASIVVAGQRQFTATVLDQYGNAIPNSTLNWTVSGTQVGTLTPIDADTIRLNTGTVADTYPAGLRVSSDGLTQTASITLRPGPLSQVLLNPTSETFKPNELKTFSAQAVDQYGNEILGLNYAWALNSTGILTPSGDTATYQAGTTAGVYTNAIQASATQSAITRIGYASVAINPADIASITVTPSSATLQPNATQLFTARAFDPFGNEISSFGVNWSTLGTGFVQASGATTATVRSGTIAGVYANAVRASAGGVTGTAGITVQAGPLASIDVQPTIAVMGATNIQTFTAAGLDAWGNAVPGFVANWSATVAAGAFDSTSAASAVFRSSSSPGTYNNAIKAQNGAVIGNASVIVLQGTVAGVNVTPASATGDIGATRLFTATVVDKFGNPFPQLSVLWQLAPANVGTIVSTGPLTALIKLGTKAGAFANALLAYNGAFSGKATLTINPGQPAAVDISANPATLTTDGISTAQIVVQVTDAYGNAVGAGHTVSLNIDQCSGTCALGVTSAATDPQGRIVTTLRSDYRSPGGTTQTIRVSATSNTLFDSVNVAGQFIPFKAMLPALNREFPLSNHTSCSALLLNSGDSVRQAADNAFNIYRFKGTASAHTVAINTYAATGRLLLYRIVSDKCASSNTMTVVYLGEASITSSTLYQKTFTGLASGQTYLLAVNTTAAFTSQTYTLSVTP